MKICTNETYRKHVAELATTLFHHYLTVPKEGDTEQVAMQFIASSKKLQEYINENALILSNQYNIPIIMVHNDIRECAQFLPKKDLTESFNARKEERIH